MNVLESLRRAPLVLALGVALSGLAGLASAQTNGATSTNAARGQRLYAARCASCHGGSLQGGSGPALRGNRFFTHARRNPPTAADLNSYTRANMPPGAPGSLSSPDSLAITEYIVRTNGIYRDPQPLTAQRAGALRLR